MPLKYHLIIVSVIIAVVFAGWQGMKYQAALEASRLQVAPPKNLINIIRASWGVNCDSSVPAGVTRTRTAGDYDPADSNIIKENNILEQIKQLCHGKPDCTIRNHPDAMGFDPAPYCYDKRMLVEYRCYSFDRLWQLAILPNDSGKIDCSNAEPPK